MAGGEPRFGTTAIYMPTLLLQTSDSVKLKEAHISLVTCQHSASEDLNNVLISRDFSGQPKRELQLSLRLPASGLERPMRRGGVDYAGLRRLPRRLAGARAFPVLPGRFHPPPDVGARDRQEASGMGRGALASVARTGWAPSCRSGRRVVQPLAPPFPFPFRGVAAAVAM